MLWHRLPLHFTQPDTLLQEGMNHTPAVRHRTGLRVSSWLVNFERLLLHLNLPPLTQTSALLLPKVVARAGTACDTKTLPPPLPLHISAIHLAFGSHISICS
jgi:hypothetical protein